MEVEEIQCAVTRELNNISKTAFLKGMKKFKERVNKFTVDPRVTTGLTYEQFGLRPKF
jgi:hypothetical protein